MPKIFSTAHLLVVRVKKHQTSLLVQQDSFSLKTFFGHWLQSSWPDSVCILNEPPSRSPGAWHVRFSAM